MHTQVGDTVTQRDFAALTLLHEPVTIDGDRLQTCTQHEFPLLDSLSPLLREPLTIDRHGFWKHRPLSQADDATNCHGRDHGQDCKCSNDPYWLVFAGRGPSGLTFDIYRGATLGTPIATIDKFPCWCSVPTSTAPHTGPDAAMRALPGRLKVCESFATLFAPVHKSPSHTTEIKLFPVSNPAHSWPSGCELARQGV